MKKINKIIIQACLFQGWHKFIIGLLIPILVLFQLERGISLLFIGFNMAMYSGTVIILEIPSGILADIIGHKKISILSIMINVLSMLVLLLAKDAIQISAAFILWGAGRAFSSGSMEAIFINKISVNYNEQGVEKLITSTQFAIPMGLAAGALLGGLLPDLHLTQIYLISLSDYFSLNFFTAAVMYILLAVFFIIFVADSAKVSNQSVENKSKLETEGIVTIAINTIKNSSVFSIIMITTLIWGFAFSGIETFWQPRLFEISGDSRGTFIYGLLTTGYFMAGAIASLFSWPLCRLFGNKPLIFLFSQRLILGGLFIILSYITNVPWFAAVYIGLFLFTGISGPVEASILNREIPSKSRATLLSVESFALQVGGIAGSLAGGFMSEFISISFTWQIAALTLMVSSFAYLWVNNKRNPAI